MELQHIRLLQIDLRDDEIESLKEVIRLAYTQLHSSPCIQMHGNPGQKQAGLSGPELFRVKSMLEKFGQSLGIDCADDKKPEPSYPVATI